MLERIAPMQLREVQRPLSGTGGLMRPRRYRPGTLALREIRFQFYKTLYFEDCSEKFDRYIDLHIDKRSSFSELSP